MKLDEARAIEAEFAGEIATTHPAQAEFAGATVIVPASDEDVERALMLARAAGGRVFVRSGGLASVDEERLREGREGRRDIVLSTEGFSGAAVEGRMVRAGAATTTAQLAEALGDADLFLPTGDDPTRSLASTLLDPEPPFPRSAPGATLRGALSTARVTPVEGEGAGHAASVEAMRVAPFLDGERAGVMTGLELDAGAFADEESERWLEVRVAVYTRAGFAKLCDELFGSPGVPEAVDLSVRVTTAEYGLRLVVVRATGRAPADRPPASQLVDGAMQESTVVPGWGAEGPGASMQGWVASGPGAAADDEIPFRFGPARTAFRQVRDELLEAIDYAVGSEDGDEPGLVRDRSPGIHAWVEIALRDDGDVRLRACVVDAGAAPEVAKEAAERFRRVIPAPPAPVGARGMLRGVGVLPDGFAPVPTFWPTPTEPPQTFIPDFDGKVRRADQGAEYDAAADQYARSSYDSATVRARMTPAFVAYPKHARDVIAAVRFAAAHSPKLAVVARSGGHQYCGLSSGGKDTLVLDVSELDHVEFLPGARVAVGPGTRLRRLSKALRKGHVTIPHGECPLVALGGHVQTGGVGHQLRTLGLTQDHVVSFKMVVRDAAGACEEREYRRPAGPPGQPGSAVTDDDVFRAVLGGGPGSWGVLTELTFELIADGSRGVSESWNGAYLYEHGAFREGLEQLRLWAEEQHAGTLPAGADYFLSMVSGDLRPLQLQTRPPVVLIEAMSTSREGRARARRSVEMVDAGRFSPLSCFRGEKPLSEIADDGVRGLGLFGMSLKGREFDLPYVKSLYISKTPFTPTFRDAFADLVDRAHRTQGLKVVVQAVVGGGEFAALGADTTYMQRRDALLQLVFDVFHEPELRAQAWAFQGELRDLLAHYSGGDDLRMFWGTFEVQGANGSELDLSSPYVQALYFDTDGAGSPRDLPRLREIKRHVDPGDVFRTMFTVPV